MVYSCGGSGVRHAPAPRARSSCRCSESPRPQPVAGRGPLSGCPPAKCRASLSVPTRELPALVPLPNESSAREAFTSTMARCSTCILSVHRRRSDASEASCTCAKMSWSLFTRGTRLWPSADAPPGYAPVAMKAVCGRLSALRRARWARRPFSVELFFQTARRPCPRPFVPPCHFSRAQEHLPAASSARGITGPLTQPPGRCLPRRSLKRSSNTSSRQRKW